MNRIVFRSPFCKLQRCTIIASNTSITAAAATTTEKITTNPHRRFVTTTPSGFNHRHCVLFNHYQISKKTTGLSRCSFSSTSNTTTGGTTANTNDNSSSSSNSLDRSSEIRSVYVHPLSQVVLEYLQDCRYEWIIEKGLDRSLALHRDGSFEIKFVPQRPFLSSINDIDNENGNGSNDDKSRNTETTESISIRDENNDIMEGKPTTTNESSSSSTVTTSTSHVATTTTTTTTTTTDDNIRIWTSYDEQEKKHWLTVRKGLFRQRFLLQDNLLSAWNGNGNRGTSEHIHVAVDELIHAVDRLESSPSTGSTSSSSSSSSSQTTPQMAFPRQTQNHPQHQQQQQVRRTGRYGK